MTSVWSVWRHGSCISITYAQIFVVFQNDTYVMAVCGLGLKCDGSVADDLTVGAAQRAADVLDFDVTQYHHRRFVAGREQLHLVAVGQCDVNHE